MPATEIYLGSARKATPFSWRSAGADFDKQLARADDRSGFQSLAPEFCKEEIKNRRLDDVTNMTQVMNGGKVQFCFKLGFLSTQSKGDGNYKFKLTCATPALSMHPLEATTPAWKCISREIKKRGGVSAGSAGSAGSGAIIL